MKKHQKSPIPKDVAYHIAGWILFLLCALFFLASSVQNHDPFAFVGSGLFFIACFAFLIPLFASQKQTDHETAQQEERSSARRETWHSTR